MYFINVIKVIVISNFVPRILFENVVTTFDSKYLSEYKSNTFHSELKSALPF